MAPLVTLYTAERAANPPSIAILLEELGIGYDVVHKAYGDGPNGLKAPDFLKINPNGRVPVIVDHTNDDFVIWESGAILLYVAEKIDKQQKFIGKTLEEKADVWQWLMFQMSGLGPMQVQHFSFKFIHPVKDLDQSVYDRYRNETYRVWGVLEKQLESHKWIACDKLTIADMNIYPWVLVGPVGDLELEKYPKLEAYVNRIKDLPSVVAAYQHFKPT